MAVLHVRRAKNGTSATHPLSGREMRELRRHQQESPSSPFVLVSELGAPLSATGFSRMIERAVTSKTPVLYTSGRSATDGMKSLFAERSAFLSKPYTVQQLTSAVANLLDGGGRLISVEQ